MVVSINKTDLHMVKGHARLHLPYKIEEIVAWAEPVVRQIPPLKFKKNIDSRPCNYSTAVCKKTTVNIDSIEFGGNDGYFFCLDLQYLKVENTDFGNQSGYFDV
jgi:hypothetical protein